MTLKPSLLVGCLLVSAFSPAWAQTLTVQVYGELRDAVCTPNLTEALSGGNTVIMPDVTVADLNAAGKTAGPSSITFTAHGCTGHGKNNMWVHFTADNVDAQGRIETSHPAVRFELRNNTVSGPLVRAGGTAGTSPTNQQGTSSPFSGSHPTDSNRSASKTYAVRYYAAAAVTSGGTVSANVTAHFKYH